MRQTWTDADGYFRCHQRGNNIGVRPGSSTVNCTWKPWRFERRGEGVGHRGPKVKWNWSSLSRWWKLMRDTSGLPTPWAIVPSSFKPGKGRRGWGEKLTAAIWRTGWYQLPSPCASPTTYGGVRLILSRCHAVIGQRSIRLNKLPRPGRTTNAGAFYWERWFMIARSRAAFPLTACGKSRRSEVERIEANKVFGGEPTASARNC